MCVHALYYLLAFIGMGPTLTVLEVFLDGLRSLLRVESRTVVEPDKQQLSGTVVEPDEEQELSDTVVEPDKEQVIHMSQRVVSV